MSSQIQPDTSDPIQRGTINAKPYPASFLDRFMDVVERLPVPHWLTYLAFFDLHSIMNHVLSWYDG